MGNLQWAFIKILMSISKYTLQGVSGGNLIPQLSVLKLIITEPKVHTWGSLLGSDETPLSFKSVNLPSLQEINCISVIPVKRRPAASTLQSV